MTDRDEPLFDQPIWSTCEYLRWGDRCLLHGFVMGVCITTAAWFAFLRFAFLRFAFLRFAFGGE